MVREETFRRVMGSFPTGVTVVASRDGDGRAVGLTVSAFTSVSLDPPLVLVCIHRNADAHDPILESGDFGVSILAEDQEDLAVRFSREEPELRFRDLLTAEGARGSPRMEGALGWLECRVHAVFPGGDHSVILGEVMECDGGDGNPLLFFRGSLAEFRP